MSDIVERLRQVAAAYKSLPTSGIWATMTVDRDASCNNLTDAADEIERLRAEVAGLRTELLVSLADNKGLREWLKADARCPCCDTTDACVEGCTFATDCPQDAERMAEVRALLAARKGEAC